MKVQWSYETFIGICDEMAAKLKALEWDLELVAVSRGGCTAAHRIAYKLKLPLNFYSPAEGCLAYMPKRNGSTLVFIEDLVAKGRTYNKVAALMTTLDHKWMFCPVLIDAGLEDKKHLFPIHGVISKDWIAFPYEDFEAVKEGDWGLFREGTSESAKKS